MDTTSLSRLNTRLLGLAERDAHWAFFITSLSGEIRHELHQARGF